MALTNFRVQFLFTTLAQKHSPALKTPWKWTWLYYNTTKRSRDEAFVLCWVGRKFANPNRVTSPIITQIQKKLFKRVFGSSGLTQTTKLMVYRTVVISTLLYTCEFWVLYPMDIRKLKRFHQRKLHQILRNTWQGWIANNDVLLRAKIQSLESIMTRHQLRSAGHFAWMPDSRLIK